VLLQLLARWPALLPLLSALASGQPVDDGVQFYSLKESNPEPSLAWFILNAFLLIGVAILVILVVGIAFGSLRLWLLERFPHNRFNGVPDDEISRTFRLTDDAER
jgi:hypothetical protein